MKRTLLFVLTAIAIVSCNLFSTPSATNTPLRTATFDYNPPESSSKRPDIVVMLMKPTYGESLGAMKDAKPFNTMLNSMEKDFEEIITKRGFTMRGPFSSYGNVNFPDKEAAPLLLEVEVDLSFVEMPGGVKTASNVLTGTSYYFSGEAEISGRVNLVFKESFTQERIDNPSVEIPKKRFSASSEKKYTTNSIPMSDPGIYNPLTQALEEVYDEVMTTAWNKLDPNQVSRYMSSVKSIRDRKGF